MGDYLNKTKKSGRIFYFDALRALSIIAVIMFHVYLRFTSTASAAGVYHLHSVGF